MAVASQARAPAEPGSVRLAVRRIDALPDPERAFAHLYGASESAFWLDGGAAGERARFSFMGDAAGPLASVVSYDVGTGRVRVKRGARIETRRESIFDHLERERRRWRALASDFPGLPFDFDCGFAGYLGYELKAECDGVAAHEAATPDAAFVFADRLIAFDRRERRTYLAQLHRICPPRGGRFDAAAPAAGGGGWIEETARRLAALPALPEPAVGIGPPALRLRRSRERYLADVAACRRHLAAGHSYEICLTNKVAGEADADPLTVYRSLRRANPAPFSAFLRFGELAVLSSSPERFLAVDGEGWAESRPIKGTSRRGATPEEDARLARALGEDGKSRAENVTIVDLVRNDLGRVCEPGTVGVPELMRVETYETVHQLVSAVRGRLRAGVGAVECARACFPPGSMTGAPKRRTMEILDELEGEARGVYSGAIGYFGLGGACDLSVAIRTIALDGERIELGAGGAIVADSDPAAELSEMLLKAAAPAAALGPGAAISFDSPVLRERIRSRPPSPTPS